MSRKALCINIDRYIKEIRLERELSDDIEGWRASTSMAIGEPLPPLLEASVSAQTAHEAITALYDEAGRVVTQAVEQVMARLAQLGE